MDSEYAIETQDLTKVYISRWKRREVRAIDGVSLQVRRGTIFGLLGPNGAGKTTFVKTLLSAVRPTHGTRPDLRARRQPAGSAPAHRVPAGESPLSHLLHRRRHARFLRGALWRGRLAQKEADSRATGTGGPEPMGRHADRQIFQRHAAAPGTGASSHSFAVAF